LTPRAKAWLGGLASLLPEDQSSQIVHSLTDHAYTSVETILGESEENLLAVSGVRTLKAGADIAFKKRLAELRVSDLLTCSCFWLFEDKIYFIQLTTEYMLCRLCLPVERMLFLMQMHQCECT
jgi:hypothetical protein